MHRKIKFTKAPQGSHSPSSSPSIISSSLHSPPPMAIRNRKLFPTLTSSSSSNETIYCPDFCDPTCPYYNCPDVYFSSPPPPPPPPTPPPNSTTAKAGPFSPSLITALALLSGFFILLAYYVIIVKSCFCRRSRNNPQPSPSEIGNEEFLDENRVDHPIWFITTVGLQQSIINAITACKYRKGEGLIEGSECSVCLNDFREGETLRLLPKCSHAFHIRCIDTWLRSHTNCPLCRANIVAPCGAGYGTTRAQSELLEQHGQHPDVIRAAHVEDLRESNRHGEDLPGNGSLGNMAATEEAEELQEEVGGEIALKDHSACDDDLLMQEEIELEKRSAPPSIDDSSPSSSSSSKRQIHVEVEVHRSSAPTAAMEQDVGPNNLLKMAAAAASADSSLTGQYCPGTLARSRSCSSGFFLSRHSRTASSNLPF